MFHLLFIVPTVAIAEVQAVAAGPQLDLMGHAGSTFEPMPPQCTESSRFLA